MIGQGLNLLEWVNYDFMKNALVAVILIAPVFGLMGTMVVNNRMAFFTDVLGHSALAGIGIGLLFGFSDPTLPTIGMAAFLAIIINLLKKFTQTSMDTILSVFLAFMIALGVVLLSREGGFSKYAHYLIGDILSVSPIQLVWIAGCLLVTLAFWIFAGNALILTSLNTSLARSRHIRTFLVETCFTILLAIVVMVSMRLVGILIINSLLVLPAAASRNISRNACAYTSWAVAISLVAGVTGLVASYFWGTSSGATIVLVAVGFYVLSILVGCKGKP